MLASKLRISKSEFKTLGRGYGYHSPFFTLFVYKNINNKSQFSFLCSKKVSKTAVRRNLLRRRGYNAIKKKVDSIKSGFYCVFTYKKEAVDEIRYEADENSEFKFD